MKTNNKIGERSKETTELSRNLEGERQKILSASFTVHFKLKSKVLI